MIIIECSTITCLCVFADERPDITIKHDSEKGEFIIICVIPGSDIGGYTCFLSLGDEYPQFKKIQSHEQSGKNTVSIFFLYSFFSCANSVTPNNKGNIM